MRKGQSLPKELYGMIDEPTPYDTLEIWQDHLKSMEALPKSAVERDVLIRTARQTIAEKKRQQAA